jgi:hypothetical protein
MATADSPVDDRAALAPGRPPLRRSGVLPADVTSGLRALARGSGVALPALIFGAAGLFQQRLTNAA